ncbi:MAG: M28 family peptidase, partial [Candidatus Bathyarchaeia archaeon]
TFRYCVSTFSGGSDHVQFNNSTVRVPCVMLLQWPDLYYHTSMDTIDKVSADTLKRVGWIVTIATLTLANAATETVFLLASQTAKNGIIRIEEATREAIEELFRKMEYPKFKDKPEELAKELAKTVFHFKSKIKHIIWREQEAVKSVKRIEENPKLDAFLSKYCEDIANLGQKEITTLEEAWNFVAKSLNVTFPVKLEETETEAELKKLIPKKLFKGTLEMDALKQLLSEKEYEWYQEILEKDMKFRIKMEEIVNFIDGKRSAYHILRAVSAEYDETNPEYVLKLLRDMEKAKLITFE